MTNKQINREFLIRRYPAYDGSRNNTLLSAATLQKEVGPELSIKMVEKAIRKGRDKATFKLRRGIKIEIVSK